jgi:hypothetical protein
MQWDLGLEGLSALTALSVGFGVLAGLLVGDGWRAGCGRPPRRRSRAPASDC